MRTLLATFFIALTCAIVVGSSEGQQPPKDDKKAAQPKFDPPKIAKPDEDMLKNITAKTEELRRAIAELKVAKKKLDRPEVDPIPDVEICLVAAERIVRHQEWFAADSGKKTLQTLDIGLARASALAKGQKPWLNVRGKWVVLGYRSRIDDSVQPYAVVFPNGYGEPNKTFRLDLILHGRNASLAEATFIAGNDGKTAPATLDHVEVQVFGRGNNAYRWAGETDVFEAETDAKNRVLLFRESKPGESVLSPVNPDRIVLRGFSMGGAGTWHLGLHHPDAFCVIGPGAGFTTTHGYIGGLPKQLPDFQEKCLHIYDAQDYAENAFNVPVVAYSGERDAQKAAADNIEKALKDFKEPLRFTHLIAPGLEHQMPPEWQAKAEAEYRKYADKGRDPSPERVRFVTYTPRYGSCDSLIVDALEITHSRGIVDSTRKGNSFTISTINIHRLLIVSDPKMSDPFRVTIDGQVVSIVEAPAKDTGLVILEKSEGKWSNPTIKALRTRLSTNPVKRRGMQGPIDDAFLERFEVVRPSTTGWNGGIDRYVSAAIDEFAFNWDKYFHGTLPITQVGNVHALRGESTIVFGDPQSNPLIAKVLPKLPIKWSKDELIVNGVKYDPKTHVPVLIYPNPLNDYAGYIVLNSGHTFHEVDLKGTNALLYPRLGDWAVIKPTPTEKDPASFEVVAAGLFDENWQFPKK